MASATAFAGGSVGDKDEARRVKEPGAVHMLETCHYDIHGKSAMKEGGNDLVAYQIY